MGEPNLSQWGALDWDDELDELCSSPGPQTVQSTTDMNTEAGSSTTPNGENYEAQNQYDGPAEDHTADNDYATQSPEESHSEAGEHQPLSQDLVDAFWGDDIDGISDDSADSFSQASDDDLFDAVPEQPVHEVQGYNVQQHNDTSVPTNALVPFHPGWTSTLSQSLSHEHSTPPEVNNWAYSVPIMYSINFEFDRGEDNLRRCAVLTSALLRTDDRDFSGYQYPYGAMGYKRLLLTRPKAAEYRKNSVLKQSNEILQYTDSDYQTILSNVRSQLSAIRVSDQLEETLALATNQPLPGLDFVDDFMEESHAHPGNSLDMVDLLIHELELADAYMTERLKHAGEIASVTAWAEEVTEASVPSHDDTDKSVENDNQHQADPLDYMADFAHFFQPSNYDEQGRLKHLDGIAAQTQQQETLDVETDQGQDQEELQVQSGLFSTFFRIGGFLRECWNENPMVLP